MSTVTFDIYISRALSFYVTKAVIPSIILTYLSFGTLLLDARAGERLSYSATLFLASVAMDITFSEFIPACSEWLWMQTLIFVSLVMSAITIGVSLYVVWLYYLDRGEGEDFEGHQTPIFNVRRVGSWRIWKEFRRENGPPGESGGEEGDLGLTLETAAGEGDGSRMGLGAAQGAPEKVTVDERRSTFRSAFSSPGGMSEDDETRKSVHMKARSLNR